MGAARERLSEVIRDLQAMRAAVVNASNLHASHAKDKIASLTQAGYGLTELGEAYRMIEQAQSEIMTAAGTVTATIAKVEAASGG